MILNDNIGEQSKLNIVLVDDKPYFRKGMKDLLLSRFNNKIGAIEEVADGMEFLILLDVFPANLVFMDIDMPVINGIEATTLAHSKHPEMKIYALSAHDEPEFVQTMSDAGVEGFISKNEELDSRLELIINNIFINKKAQVKESNSNKIDALLNKLILECPVATALENCTLCQIRKLPVVERMNWLQRLSKIEKIELAMNHRKCMLKREM